MHKDIRTTDEPQTIHIFVNRLDQPVLQIPKDQLPTFLKQGNGAPPNQNLTLAEKMVIAAGR